MYVFRKLIYVRTFVCLVVYLSFTTYIVYAPQYFNEHQK